MVRERPRSRGIRDSVIEDDDAADVLAVHQILVALVDIL
jgi:hypothetical protein